MPELREEQGIERHGERERQRRQIGAHHGVDHDAVAQERQVAGQWMRLMARGGVFGARRGGGGGKGRHHARRGPNGGGGRENGGGGQGTAKRRGTHPGRGG